MAGAFPRRLIDGVSAERRAERYLRRQGLKLVTRNYRCRGGEIDLVMRDDDCTVIVEVRYRKPDARVDAALTVDESKQRKLVLATRFLLAETPALADFPIRFDVVAIRGPQAGRGAIQWIRDAFRI